MSDGPKVFVPIEGLVVVEPFPVGIVVFRSADDVIALLGVTAPTYVHAGFREIVRQGNVTAFAEVPRNDVTEAAELAGQAVQTTRG